MPALLEALWDLLLPPTCAGCGGAPSPAGSLCADCHAGLPWIAADACPRCQERPVAAGERRCRGCVGRTRPLESCVAACWFEGPAADWLRAFKYRARQDALSAVARSRVGVLAAAAACRMPGPVPDCIVPVPLHPRRVRARGFNPAVAIAREMARVRGAPCDPVALARTRDTPSQTGRGRSARARNVRGAFAARRSVPATVWLVDDVVTTGATLSAAARALRQSGARRVLALCCARTPQRSATSR